MDEIEKLLEQADTPRDRAFLLIMYKIADKLTDLDGAFHNHRKEYAAHREQDKVDRTLFNHKFDAHVTEEQALLNKGLGAWMVVTGVLIIVLGVGGWYVVRHILDVAQQQQSNIERNSNRLTAIETMVKQHVENGGKP
jgi:hypothetical protein